MAMATAARADRPDGAALIGQDWDSIVAMARGSEVNGFIWGGADKINAYVTQTIGAILRDDHDNTLNLIPLTETVYTRNIVLGEQQAGNLTGGAVDAIWINGGNFRSMRRGNQS